MKMLMETEARAELVKAIHCLDYEGLARVYSWLIDDESVLVTPDGEPCVFSGTYQRGHYIIEHREGYTDAE